MLLNQIKKLRDGSIISNKNKYMVISDYNEENGFEVYDEDGNKYNYSLAAMLKKYYRLQKEGDGELIGNKVKVDHLYTNRPEGDINGAYNLLVSKLSKICDFNTKQTKKYISFRKKLNKFAFIEVWVQKTALKIYTRQNLVSRLQNVDYTKEKSKNRVMDCYIRVKDAEDLKEKWKFIQSACKNYSE